MQANAEKLNNNFIAFPRAFLGKLKYDKDGNLINDGAEHFIPKSGKRRYLSSAEIILGAIHKINSKYDNKVKLTYELLCEETGLCSATIWRNLNDLEEDGILEFKGTSRYSIVPEFSENSYFIIYSFLLEEELNLGNKKVIKRLSKNAVLFLCEIIAFYLNEENKYKYFRSGEKRAAATLKVALSTAYGIIDELIKVGAIYRKVAHKDSAGNIMLKNGAGKSNVEYTIFKVAPKLLSRCKRIKKEAENRRKAKEEQQQTETPPPAEQPAEQSADIVTEQGEEVFIKPKKAKTAEAKNAQDTPTKNNRRRSDTIEGWLQLIAKYKTQRPPNQDNKE